MNGILVGDDKEESSPHVIWKNLMLLHPGIIKLLIIRDHNNKKDPLISK